MLNSAVDRPYAASQAAVTSILVVDDDPAIREGVALLLEQAGYRVSRAASAAEALDLLTEPPLPSLVILDVRMPDADGFAVCRRIRATSPYVPVLMLTACDTLLDKVTGLELGADDYVVKPFEPSELLARVRAILRFASQHGLKDSSLLMSGPVRLDRVEHRAMVRGRPVDLTSREWALLECFITHPGHVFGREMLLRRVWGDAYLGDSRAVDMLVKRLRAKVEDDPEQPHLIQTVRGFGYRFVAGEE
jgi:DNA-binding response OmpR family regulator